MDNDPGNQPPSSPIPPRQPVGPDYWKPKRRRWPWYMLIGLLLIAAILLIWLWQHPKQPQPSVTNQSSTQIDQTPIKTQTKPPATTTSYDSTNFNLSFDYPKDWTVTDSGNGRLELRSTTLSLQAADGQNVDGQIVMTIANKGKNLGAFDKGDATAVLDSQKIAYTKPTPAQRADTYLSFLQYAQDTTTGALDSVDITGDFGYQKGQDIPKTDVAKIDPLVTITFVKCATSACPAGTANGLSITASSWNDTAFQPITDVLKSLSFN